MVTKFIEIGNKLRKKFLTREYSEIQLTNQRNTFGPGLQSRSRKHIHLGNSGTGTVFGILFRVQGNETTTQINLTQNIMMYFSCRYRYRYRNRYRYTVGIGTCISISIGIGIGVDTSMGIGRSRGVLTYMYMYTYCICIHTV